MRSRILPAVGVSAFALVAATTFAPMASAQHAPNAVLHHSAGVVHYAHTGATCFSQGTKLDQSAVSSQNFEKANDAFDDMAADDFKVGKAGCKITKVSVAGFYSSGTADSENVTFYANKGGKPGATVKTFANKAGTDDAGTFVIKLGKKGISLKKGTYWVSVQINMDAGTAINQWYWATAKDGTGADAMWQNPKDGFGVCKKWDSILTCNGVKHSALAKQLREGYKEGSEA